MKILIVYFTQTKNTEKVARGIFDELSISGHEVHMEEIYGVTPDVLDDYDLIFVGSACHDADIAEPVKLLLEGLSDSPPFKLAGFVTHATYKEEGDERERAIYERWAGKCIKSFHQISREKNVEFLGFFNCQGKPTPEIAEFIHQVIVTEEDDWTEYIEEVNKHPNEDDIQKAKAFARNVVADYK